MAAVSQTQTREEILEKSRKRLADTRALAKRHKYKRFVVVVFMVALTLLGVVAVFYSTSNETASFLQHSYGYTTQNAAGGYTWVWNTAAKVYNTTYTGVSVWVHNISPTNVTDAPVAPPPAPPKEAPTSPPEAAPVPPPPAPPKEAPTLHSQTKTTPPSDAPPLNSSTTDANNKKNSTNNATTDSDSETDSNYTVLEVVGNAVSYVCGFAGFMFMMALQQG